ncbi:MAG TPA: hypothetical protein VMD09_00440 [Solirubrobacteraceae bacterium]|nr:hypothetical protein [Solirubrobacteraceae bacterium]
MPRSHQSGAALGGNVELALIEKVAERHLVQLVEACPRPLVVVDLLCGGQGASAPIVGQFVWVSFQPDLPETRWRRWSANRAAFRRRRT